MNENTTLGPVFLWVLVTIVEIKFDGVTLPKGTILVKTASTSPRGAWEAFNRVYTKGEVSEASVAPIQFQSVQDVEIWKD